MWLKADLVAQHSMDGNRVSISKVILFLHGGLTYEGKLGQTVKRTG